MTLHLRFRDYWLSTGLKMDRACEYNNKWFEGRAAVFASGRLQARNLLASLGAHCLGVIYEPVAVMRRSRKRRALGCQRGSRYIEPG